MINLIQVRNESLVFDPAINKLFGYCFKLKQFELFFDEVVLVGIKLGICLDDDYESLVFITSKKKEFFIPYPFINDDIKKALKLKFSIDIEKEFGSFKFEDYDKYFNKIIFPKNMYGNRIYKDLNLIGNLKLITKKFFLGKQYASGVLSKHAERLLDSENIAPR